MSERDEIHEHSDLNRRDLQGPIRGWLDLNHAIVSLSNAVIVHVDMPSGLAAAFPGSLVLYSLKCYPFPAEGPAGRTPHLHTSKITAKPFTQTLGTSLIVFSPPSLPSFAHTGISAIKFLACRYMATSAS